MCNLMLFTEWTEIDTSHIHLKQFLCTTLRSQIEGYTPLPAVIWASPFINFQENFQPPCFFTYSNEKNSTLPAVIRAYPLIKFEEKFQPTLLLELPLVLET